MLNKIIQGDDLEKITTDILNQMHLEGPIKAVDFEILSYIKKFHQNKFEKYEKKLLYLMGLFYKVKEPTNILEEIYSLYADSIEAETGKRLTPVQADALKKIHQKVFFSFSAPTSAGKSFLFRELIQKNDGDIVIVVPSRALIAEYMHAVVNLVDKSVLVLQFIDNVNIKKTKRRIFIITPERGIELFSHLHEFNIQLFLLDEAQISEEDVRGMKFDSFIRRIDKLLPKAKKVFSHPFVNNPEAQLKKHNFKINAAFFRYDQNTVGKIFMCIGSNGLDYFSPFLENRQYVTTNEDIVADIIKNKGTMLVYISKSKIYDGKYMKDFSEYLEMCPKLTDSKAIALINEIKNFIGIKSNNKDKRSLMINMMERGVVIHHGSIPLKARLIIERFVRGNYARMCFATSTLNQGINMPFDGVWIDNFTKMDTLTLKNLIGRAGRTTNKNNVFEYGYTIIKKANVNTFCKRIKEVYNLSESSMLDESSENTSEDLQDIVEAIKNDNFNDDFRLTESQVQRLDSDTIYDDIKFILDSLMLNSRPLTAKEYYMLTETQRKKIKSSFKKIYIQHLRRNDLTQAETSILSTAIPIMLWHVQGKSFGEIISLRYAFLSEKDKQREVYSRLKKKKISQKQAQEEIDQIMIRFTPIATTLPNIKASQASLFKKGTPISELSYDTLIYDTYDYLDKVIALSLADPLCAAFQLYFNKTKDKRAMAMKNYIKYGTNDEQEIWLLRYGFAFEDIEWLKEYVEYIDEFGISFNEAIKDLDENRLEVINRYL